MHVAPTPTAAEGVLAAGPRAPACHGPMGRVGPAKCFTSRSEARAGRRPVRAPRPGPRAAQGGAPTPPPASGATPEPKRQHSTLRGRRGHPWRRQRQHSTLRGRRGHPWRRRRQHSTLRGRRGHSSTRLESRGLCPFANRGRLATAHLVLHRHPPECSGQGRCAPNTPALSEAASGAATLFTAAGSARFGSKQRPRCTGGPCLFELSP